jgi:hypothetical protein
MFSTIQEFSDLLDYNKFNVFHVRALYYTKNITHQQMHKGVFSSLVTLLHVSTLLGHLQGELSAVVTLWLHFIVELLIAYCAANASRDHRESAPPKGHAVHNQELNYKVQS